MPTVLITGANRGIGLAFCREFLEKKYEVLACYRELSKAQALKQLALEFSEQLSLFPLDVESEENIHQLAKNLNNKPIDILINNAGFYEFDIKSDHLSIGKWNKFFAVNTIGPYLLTLNLIENLKLGQGKKVINITSFMASIALNDNALNIPYRASKSALNSLTKSLSIAYRNDNVIVTAIHPGWVSTDMGGKDAPLTPEESVKNMVEQIEKLELKNSGKFLSYDGYEVAW